MYDRLGHVLVHRAKLVLSVSLLAFLGLVLTGASVFGNLLGEGFADPAAHSTRAAELVDREFGGEPDLVFVVHARTGTVDDPQVTADAAALAERLRAEPVLTDITSYFTDKPPGLRSEDGTDALVLAQVRGGDDAAQEENAVGILDTYVDADTEAITVDIGGPLGVDIGGQVEQDLLLAEAIAVPLILILLLLAFGSLVAALLPLMVSLFAVAGTFAVLNVLTTQVSVSVFAINLATALGLGLGVDYALFMVSRYREELARGRSTEEAVARTVRTAGRTVVFSAVTVAIALSALLVFPVYFLKSFAYAGVAVTVFAAIAALIVLPAALAVLGTRVNAGRLPWAKVTGGADSPLVGRIATAVMRRPVFAAVPVMAIMLIAAAPLLDVRFGTPDDRVLPQGASSHLAGDALRENFSSNESNPIDIITTGTITPAALGDYARTVSTLPNVVQVNTSAGIFAAGQASDIERQGAPLVAGDSQRIEAILDGDPVGDPAQDLVRQIRALPAPAGSTELLVGGTTASLIDAKYAISSNLLLAGSIIVLATLFVLFLFTGSVVQPQGSRSRPVQDGTAPWPPREFRPDSFGPDVIGCVTVRPGQAEAADMVLPRMAGFDVARGLDLGSRCCS